MRLQSPDTTSQMTFPLPITVKAWSGPSKRRRRDILIALLEQPAGVNFPGILDEIPMWTAWRPRTVYRELARLVADGHAVRSDNGRWSTNSERVAQFTGQEN